MNLRELRELNGIKVEDVSRALNVTKTAYYRYEKGAREPSLIQIKQLAELFGESTDDIIDACLVSQVRSANQ